MAALGTANAVNVAAIATKANPVEQLKFGRMLTPLSVANWRFRLTVTWGSRAMKPLVSWPAARQAGEFLSRVRYSVKICCNAAKFARTRR